MIKDDLALLANESIPETVRAALATGLVAGGTTDADRDLEREKIVLEARRQRWNTPLVAALAGLITLTATFAFDRFTARDDTVNTITLEEVRQELAENNAQLLQELEKDKALTQAEISARAEERAFQYEIVKSELSNTDKSNAERAAVLLFLVRAGVLSTLNREELETMAQDQIANPDQTIIPRLTASTVLPGIIGPDDAIPVEDFPEDHPVHRLAQAVGRLNLLRDGNPQGVCTAFLISAERIVTADHCLSRDSTYQLILGAGTDETTHTARPVHSVARLEPGPVELQIAPPAPPGIVPLIRGDVPDAGRQLGTIYWRNGNVLLAVWGGEACRLYRQTEESIGHSCDTGPGSSGAPVFDFQTRRVIAVHQSRDENGGVAYHLSGLP